MTNNDATTTDLDYADILWKSAAALRGQIDAAEYKHVVLGLLFLFLKCISDSFEARWDELKAELEDDGISDPQIESLLERRGECTAELVFWVPPEARWQNLQNQATRADIPEPPAIKEEINTLADWIKSIRRRRRRAQGEVPA